jgi:hypothetical protein
MCCKVSYLLDAVWLFQTTRVLLACVRMRLSAQMLARAYSV